MIAGFPIAWIQPTAVSAAAAVPESGATITLIRIFVLLVGASALLTVLARRAKVPYTVVLVLFGMAAGALIPSPRFGLTPALVLAVFLPALIFEASYHIDFSRLRPSLADISLLAGPGVLVSAALVALFLAVGAGLPPAQAFVVGAMLAATDPVAVIATFDRLGSPRRLATLVEAESLFNDGTGIVAFTIALSYLSSPVSPFQMGFAFVMAIAVSATLGALTGLIAWRLIRLVDDHLIEISLSVVLAYGTYLAADALGQSGVIATAVAAIVLGNFGRESGMTETSRQALETVWEFAAFLATAFVFLLVGFAISIGQLAEALLPIAWGVAAVLAGRAIIVYGMLGALRLARARLAAMSWARRGRKEAGDVPSTATDEEVERRAEQGEGEMPFSWFHVIYWAGLRGAVSTALALSLPEDVPDRSLLQGVTFGVVLFTLLVQATTAGRVVGRWGRRRPAKPREQRPRKPSGSSGGRAARSSRGRPA